MRGPSSHEMAVSRDVTPSGSQIELTRLPEHSRGRLQPQPPPPVSAGQLQQAQPLQLPGTPRRSEAGGQLPPAPSTPKDLATEALRSTLQTLTSYLDRCLVACAVACTVCAFNGACSR